MSEYRCSQCGAMYSHTEYMGLDTVSKVTDDPEDRYGVETVCECGARFHSDKWSLLETADTESGEVEISTVALTIAHGMNHDMWFETCLFHDTGSRVVDRYRTKEEAKDGHSEYVSKIANGSFELVPQSYTIEVDNA